MNNQKIKGHVLFALKRLAYEFPLYATLISNWNIKEDESIGTFGVKAGNDYRIELYYSPSFVDKITPKECVGVLIHEVHHVIFGHLTMKEEKYPDKWALTVSQEVTCNEFIKYPLPGHPVMLKKFPVLKPQQSTIERYKILSGFTPKDRLLVTIDNHDNWNNNTILSSSEIETIISDDIKQAMNKLNKIESDKRKIELERLSETIKHAIGEGAGNSIIEMVGNSVLTPTKNWREIIRKIAWKLCYPKPTLRKPSRRFPELVGIVPGRNQHFKKPKIMIVFDTSGSMIVESILTAVKAEIHSLVPLTDNIIVECDWTIQRVYTLHGKIGKIKGGGGTSFCEPLKNDFLKKYNVKTVFFFTDGYGIAPSQAPHIPVYWCLTGKFVKKPANWGKVIRIPS